MCVIFSGTCCLWMTWQAQTPQRAGLHVTSIILKFGFIIVPQISWMYCDENLLVLPFSLIRAFLFSLVSAGSESHSSISCILLVMLDSVVSVHLPRISISSQSSVCVIFIAPHFSFQFLNCFYYLFDCFFLVSQGIIYRFNHYYNHFYTSHPFFYSFLQTFCFISHSIL